MAIFRPEIKEGSSSGFTGVCEFGITGFIDKSNDFDWCDLYIEVKVRQKGSEYDRVIQIKGSYEKEGGKITGGSCLKRLYQFFDELGCGAGINVDGGWEDSEGNSIEDIAKYLTDNHLSAVIPGTDPSFDYLGYFYREHPKTPGGKSYTRCWNKVFRNTEANKEKLLKDAQWMKSQGYIKEMTDAVENKTELSGNGLANL